MVIITFCPREQSNSALSKKSLSLIFPSAERLLNVISKITCVFSSFTFFSFKKSFLDFSYMSIFTLVTGLKLPLKANMFFLYNTCAGSKLFPSGPNITAFVIPFLSNCKLIKRLSTYIKRGPEKLIMSISNWSLLKLSYKDFTNSFGLSFK